MLATSRDTLEKAAKLLEESARHLLRLALKARRCPDCGAAMHRDQHGLSCPACGLCASDSDEPTADFSEVAPRSPGAGGGR